MGAVHLHHDDVPDTLALLGALLGDRSTEVPGYSLDARGADVDWDLLLEGWLSTTEKAVVRIAHKSRRLDWHDLPRVRRRRRGARLHAAGGDPHSQHARNRPSSVAPGSSDSRP